MNVPEKKKILIADDDYDILDAMKIMLQEMGGYDVHVTTDGHSVLDCNNLEPDLIFLDLWMCGVNGKDICKALKSCTRTKHIPVIIFSANSDIKVVAEKAGADDYLPKPFAMRELLAKTNRLITRR